MATHEDIQTQRALLRLKGVYKRVAATAATGPVTVDIPGGGVVAVSPSNAKLAEDVRVLAQLVVQLSSDLEEVKAKLQSMQPATPEFVLPGGGLEEWGGIQTDDHGTTYTFRDGTQVKCYGMTPHIQDVLVDCAPILRGEVEGVDRGAVVYCKVGTHGGCSSVVHGRVYCFRNGWSVRLLPPQPASSVTIEEVGAWAKTIFEGTAKRVSVYGGGFDVVAEDYLYGER